VQWRTLIAAMAGWMLDALDVMLYSFALLSMQQEFGLTGAQAGTLTTVTLAAAALALRGGAAMLRVHDVAPHAQVRAVFQAERGC